MSGRWTALVGHGLRLRLARRIPKLSNKAYWTSRSTALQYAQLRRLLNRATDTEFGHEHEFGKLARLDDEQMLSGYRQSVPIGDWHTYKDRIKRMRENGETDVLWPGLVQDYAQTSGTTAGDKYIPLTKEMFRSNYLASLDIFANLVRFGQPLGDLTSGHALFLGGSSDVKTNEHGIRTGDLSGLVTKLIRWPLSEIYSPGPEIALMDHWPSKIDAMARHCLDQDVRMLNGMPSWALVLFERLLQLAREQERDATCIRDLWPNLRVFVHGGVKYGPFEQRMRRAWSGEAGEDFPRRLELYPASEAFVAVQDTPGDPGLRLNVDIGNFFEFVPLSEIDADAPPAFTCDKVEKGEKYVVVLTTCAGLWRYVLGDVVEFDTIPAGLDGRGGEGPCRLRIVGRHRHFINAFGENLIGEHIENAVSTAASKAGVTVGEFTAAPIYPEHDGQRGGLELAVEIEGKPGDDTIAAFAHAFDEALKAQNVDYTTKRTESLGMAEPRVRAVAPGTFHRWMEAKGKLGGQHKCPRCANGREIIDEVIGLVEQGG